MQNDTISMSTNPEEIYKILKEFLKDKNNKTILFEDGIYLFVLSIKNYIDHINKSYISENFVYLDTNKIIFNTFEKIEEYDYKFESNYLEHLRHKIPYIIKIFSKPVDNPS